MKRVDRNILAIDLKSFYASVECIDRGLDPFVTPLVVADESRGDGTIVLAASPYIKEKYNVKSRCRLYDVPKDIPGLIIAQPKMKRYLKVSACVNDIYKEFVSEDDLFVYSIDESFLDVTDYLKRNNDTPKSYAKKIIGVIKDRLGLTVTAGIGLNLFMAKAAMDIEAKHAKDFIAEWTYESIPEHLWPIKPLSKVWGIGKRLESRLNKLGFECVGDIAVSDPEFLKAQLGVIGEEIYYHSLGYDDALLSEKYESKEHSISVGQVLLRDYHPSEMPILIMDMAYELADRLYEDNLEANEFVMYLGFKDHTSGIAIKSSFVLPVSSGESIGKEFMRLYEDKKIEPDILFRMVNMVAVDVRKLGSTQLSLFDDGKREKENRRLEKTLLDIRRRFGVQKAMPCSALSLSSTYLARRNQIGGHHA